MAVLKGEIGLENGASALELAAVFSIIAIILATALPNYVEIGNAFDRSNLRSQFEFDIRRARTEALAEGAKSIVIVSNGGSSYTVGIDYIPFNDPPSYDLVLFQRNLAPGMTISLDADAIYDSKGYLINDIGEYAQRTVTLKERGTVFCTGTLYTTGALEYNCGGTS